MMEKPDIENQTKLWQDFSDMLTMGRTLFSDSGTYPREIILKWVARLTTRHVLSDMKQLQWLFHM